MIITHVRPRAVARGARRSGSPRPFHVAAGLVRPWRQVTLGVLAGIAVALALPAGAGAPDRSPLPPSRPAAEAAPTDLRTDLRPAPRPAPRSAEEPVRGSVAGPAPRPTPEAVVGSVDRLAAAATVGPVPRPAPQSAPEAAPESVAGSVDGPAPGAADGPALTAAQPTQRPAARPSGRTGPAAAEAAPGEPRPPEAPRLGAAAAATDNLLLALRHDVGPAAPAAAVAPDPAATPDTPASPLAAAAPPRSPVPSQGQTEVQTEARSPALSRAQSPAQSRAQSSAQSQAPAQSEAPALSRRQSRAEARARALPEAPGEIRAEIPAHTPADTATEPAPRVTQAGADTPRPAARPGPMDVDIATQGAFAPARLALVPPGRPRGLVPQPAVARAVPASALAVARSPVAPVRPEAARNRFLQRAAAVRTQPGPSVATGPARGNLCGVAGIEGQSIPAVVSNVQGCGVANPVRVRTVDGVRLSQSAIMDCDTAQALHRWVRTGLKPAVGGLGGGVTELQVAGHYVCRTRNHRRGAPVSEHGRGRAIDISAVRLADGRSMDVLRHWGHGTYGPVLRAAHRAACGIFTTTLGPGSDGMHEDHFHYDLRRGGRYCR